MLPEKRGKLPQKRNVEGGCPQSAEDWFSDKNPSWGFAGDECPSWGKNNLQEDFSKIAASPVRENLCVVNEKTWSSFIAFVHL